MVEIYVLRLKGAPEEFHQRNITYANTVHSPSSIIKVDDLEAYQRVQDGAQPIGSEWVSQHSGLVNADDD
ncbi:MAG: ribosomal subunit interface protein, partial [Candidatus Aminicenantes bacterium]|nr:ribosomal subunit interface protein [Gammaproteobacteria bacterium]NIO85883.1 ribosomal subunit interface protein [Candidatus Aminicenantes bacterium]NIT27808.1 ribosomal subunit interface protein [Candidatus Aminicenantes bacterium]